MSFCYVCVDENNAALIETEAGNRTWNSFYVYVDENNASLLETGITRWIPLMCMLMKIIMPCLNRSWNDERIVALKSWIDENNVA